MPMNQPYAGRINLGAATQINPLDNPYFGTATTGEAPVGLGGADGSGLLAYDSLPDFQSFAPSYGQAIDGDSGSNPNAVNPQRFQDYLSSRGYRAFEQYNGGGRGLRYVVDQGGNVVGRPEEYNQEDGRFMTAAMLAAGVTGANVLAAGSGGAGAAGAATGGTGSQGLTFAGNTGTYGGAGSLGNASALTSGSGLGVGTGAVGTGYGSLGSMGAGAVASGSMATATAGATAGTMGGTGTGYWNGTNFTGTAPMAGSSNLGAAGATSAASTAGSAGPATMANTFGTSGMNNWIQLAQLGLGVYGASQAGGASNNATAAGERVAQGQLDLSREALDWYKSIHAEQAPNRAAAERRAQEVSDAQLGGMRFATEQARELDEYNRTTFRPMEQRFVADAAAFDTPERRSAAASAAGASVDMGINAARQAGERNLARSGIAPGSARAMGMQEDSAVAQGRARGGAMTSASRNVEQQGYARMADAVGLGRGLAPTQATQQNIATNSGTSSVGNAMQGLQAAQSGNGFMGQGFNTAMNGNQSAGNLFNQVAGGQRADDRALMDGLYGVGSAAGRLFPTSDVNKKSGTGKMADATEALKQVENTPVHAGWKYDPAKGGPDDGGQPHDGPMAQDVRKSMGEEAAPGGKSLDLVTMNGRMMAAIQALSKDVKALKRNAEMETA